MYAVPVSIYLVYISFVFCICSLIQIMGKQNLKLSHQKRSSYIKKRRSHTTPSQTLHSCLASIPQGTPSTNLHTYLARTPNTPPKRHISHPNVPIQPVHSENTELKHQNRLHHIHPKSAEKRYLPQRNRVIIKCNRIWQINKKTLKHFKIKTNLEISSISCVLWLQRVYCLSITYVFGYLLIW